MFFELLLLLFLEDLEDFFEDDFELVLPEALGLDDCFTPVVVTVFEVLVKWALLESVVLLVEEVVEVVVVPVFVPVVVPVVTLLEAVGVVLPAEAEVGALETVWWVGNGEGFLVGLWEGSPVGFKVGSSVGTTVEDGSYVGGLVSPSLVGLGVGSPSP